MHKLWDNKLVNGIIGLVLVLAFWQIGSMMFWVAIYSVVSFFCVNKLYALVQMGVILVYPLLRQYNGQKGTAKWMKYFFYIYYPAHLFVVGLIRLMVYGDIPLLF